MSAFNFRALSAQPQTADTISVFKAGTATLLTGLTDLNGVALANPFTVTAAGGVGTWGFIPPVGSEYDVKWGDVVLATSQSNEPQAVLKLPKTSPPIPVASSDWGISISNPIDITITLPVTGFYNLTAYGEGDVLISNNTANAYVVAFLQNKPELSVALNCEVAGTITLTISGSVSRIQITQTYEPQPTILGDSVDGSIWNINSNDLSSGDIIAATAGLTLTLEDYTARLLGEQFAVMAVGGDVTFAGTFIGEGGFTVLAQGSIAYVVRGATAWRVFGVTS
jgi:hypothetical protein